MKFLSNKLSVLILGVVLFALDSFGAALSGTVSIKQISDTAANAKTIAMNNARRQVLTSILSKYSNKDSLEELVENASNEDLMNLVSSMNVANEQMSATTYSANITMNLDNDAVKKWLDENDVQNWVPNMESDERFTVLMVIPNGLQDWAELKRIVRDDNVTMETQAINGNQVVVKMPLSYRTKFTATVGREGWKFSDNDGILQIWK